MYKFLFRPVFFLFSAEQAHHMVMRGMKFASTLPGSGWLFRKIFEVHHPKLGRDLWGMHFKNPVGLAAGFDKNATHIDALSLLGFSFIEAGTVTPKAQPGNPKPRLFRLKKDKGLINRMGFNNNGAEKALISLRKQTRSQEITGGNIGKNTVTPNENAHKDYLTVFKTLYDEVDYFTINVSCPNVADLRELQHTDSLKEILTTIVNERDLRPIRKPVLLKISPDLTYSQIDESLALIGECGLDGIVAVNTTTSRENLSLKPHEIAGIGPGGLSGKPLTERALEIVRYIKAQTGGKLPVIGVGGIMSVEDAINMLKAGADLIQVYSGFIYEGPFFVRNILKRLISDDSKS